VFASIQLSLASIFTTTNRSDLADDLLRQGIAASERLVTDYPLSPIYRFYLARGYQTVSVKERAGNRPAEAAQALSKAIGLLEKLSRDNPDAFYQGRLLRQCLNERSQIHRDQKNLDAAIDDLQKAIAQVEQDARGASLMFSLNQELIQYRTGLSRILAEKGDYTNAVAEVEKALETIRSAPPGTVAANQTIALQVEKAIILARSGNHASALAEAEALTVVEPTAMYNMACVHAICSKSIHDDQTWPNADRDKRSDAQAEKAMELLRSLHGGGYFKNPMRIRELMQDPDLDPLRQRPDFRKFIEDFSAKPKPTNGKN
jgi:tetratricopeptide (TPR) repeat protein